MNHCSYSSLIFRRQRNLALVALPLITACHLVKTRISDQRPAAQNSALLNKSIFIDRIGNGDTAKVQFKTTANALCRISIYSQDPSKSPNEANPMVVPCSDPDQPRQIFLERITGLRQDTLYYLNIYTWIPPQTEKEAVPLKVRETADIPSMINGDANATFRDLLVARLDIPLMTAEVFHHKSSEPIAAATVKTQLMQPMGCHQGLPNLPTNFRSADPDVGIQNLSTRDFAASNARPHPEHQGRLQLIYPTRNNGMNQWTLIYQSGGKDVSIPIQPINQLVSFEMESATITSFETPQLVRSPDTAILDPGKPVKFSWTVANTLLDPSYLIIQIGNLQSPNSVYCVFNANSGNGTIDANFVQGLEDGPQNLQVRLITNQLWVKDGWLITITDWRSGRVSK